MLVKAYGKGLSHDNVDDAPRNLVGVSPYTRGPSPDTCNPLQTFVHMLATMLLRNHEKVAVWVQNGVVLTIRDLASRGAPSPMLFLSVLHVGSELIPTIRHSTFCNPYTTFSDFHKCRWARTRPKFARAPHESAKRHALDRNVMP